jgi:hypothetical protein
LSSDLVRVQVDDVHDRRARLGAIANPDVRLPVLLVHDDLVRPGRQRNLHHLLERPRVEHVQRGLLLVGAVVVQAVGMRGQVVRVRAAADDPDHLVDRRIDDVVDVAGVVALENPDGHAVVGIEPRHPLRRRGRSECQDTEHDCQNPRRHDEPPVDGNVPDVTREGV